MAATRVQNVTAPDAGVAAITIGSGQGWVAPSAGNVLLAWYNGDNTVTTPIGFTASVFVVDGNGVYFWWKVAAGTETSVTFTQSASTDGECGLLEYSGLQATPLDTANQSPATQAGGTSSPSVSVTTTGASGSLIVALAGLHSGNSATSPTWSNGFTNIANVQNGTSGSLTNTVAFVGELQTAAPGAVSTAATWTTAMTDRQELLIAFKLAAGAVATAPPPGILFIGPTRG